MSAAGFRTRSKKTTASSKGIDFSWAIPIEELNIDEFGYEDVDDSELDLPIGLYLPKLKNEEEELEETDQGSARDYERLTTFRFIKNIASTEFELSLERCEQTAKGDFTKHIDKICLFFSKTITHFGDYSLKEIASRFSCSEKDVFKRLYTADIVTLVLGARYAINQNRLFKVVTQCGCDRKERIESDPDKGVPLLSLDAITFKYFNNDAYPLFEVTMPDGFNDGESHVDKLYFEPLRLSQTSKITDRSQGTTDRTNIIKEMCVGMPQSQIYGQKRGKVLTQDVMLPWTLKDRRYIDEKVAEINFGPEPLLKITCPHCPQAPTVDVFVNWLVDTTNVLYGSGSLAV